jgi:hypothetical protein
MVHASAAMRMVRLHGADRNKVGYLGEDRYLQRFQEFKFTDHTFTAGKFSSPSRTFPQTKGMHEYGVSSLKYLDIADACIRYMCVDP